MQHNNIGDIMKNISIWNDLERKQSYSKLNKDIGVDVLIIGGGITGISTAYHLINSGLKVCLVEKERLASGVTSRSTAKITYLQEDIYSKLTSYFDLSVAKKYLDSQKYVIDLIKDIIEKNKIDCNFEKNKSYLFEDKKIKKLEKEKNILNKLGIYNEKTNILPNNKIIDGGFFFEDSYVFHPIKYLLSLSNIISENNISIYENTKIVSIKKENNFYICKANDYTIKTKKIVFALHYPYFLLPFLMPFKCYIEKSYIGAIKQKHNYKFNAINLSKPTISLRYHSDNNSNYEIYLTNSHNTCIKDNIKDNFESIKSLNPDYIWSNKDMITYDRLPFIGSLNNDNSMLIGTGYNTWGMTNGSLAGKILADIILNKNNEYINLFDPKRSLNKGKLINFPIILGSNTFAFVKSKICKKKSFYPSNLRFEKYKGRDIAIYTDEKNKEHKVYTLCPHMKCGLLFNEIELTWDCPCHGSRFDIDGNSIEGPSNYNISFKE